MTDTDINMNNPVASLLWILGWWWWLECFPGPRLYSLHQLTDSCWWTPLRMLVLLLMASQLSHTKPLKFQLIKQITLRAWLAFYLPQNHENWNVCPNIFERCRCVGIWIWTPSDTWSRLFCFPRDENTIPGLITPRGRSEVTARETTSMGISSHLIGKAL